MKRRPRLARPQVVPAAAALIIGAAIVAALVLDTARDARGLGSAGSSVFALLTEVEFDSGEGPPTRVTLEGTGTVLFGRFVLTVAHATTQDRLETMVRSPHGTVTLPVETRRGDQKTWLLSGALRVPLTPLLRDPAADLALFRLPDNSGLPSFPYPIGDSETLDLGDPIAVLGTDPEAGPVFRPGSVAALRGSSVMKPVARSEGVFLISLALAPGESGAPVLAWRNGAYELVGLAQGTYIGPRQLAWAIRISPALEALSRAGAPEEVRRFVRLCRRAQIARLPSRTIVLPSTSRVAFGMKNSWEKSDLFGLSAQGACPIPMLTIPDISEVK